MSDEEESRTPSLLRMEMKSVDSLRFGKPSPARVLPALGRGTSLSNNPQSGKSGSADQWDTLSQIVQDGLRCVVSTADGLASGHSHSARMEAANKLIHNHARVLNDITNPSFSVNIDGRELTQLELKRVELYRAPYVDQCLREVARRLLGRFPGAHQLEVRISPSNLAQVKAWSQTTAYLDGRIQSEDAQKPGRTPDMSPEAAAAMKDVLKEVSQLSISAVTASSKPVWIALRRILETGGSFESEAEGAAAKHGHDAREGAARKLIYNHDRVLRDVINPSNMINIEGKDLTQRDLDRVAPEKAIYVAEMLQEVARRLLGHRPGLRSMTKQLNTSNAAQLDAWAKGASYLEARVQSTRDQVAGREPDTSPASAAAFRGVLMEIYEAASTATKASEMPMGAARWDEFAKMIKEEAGFSTLADGAAAAHSHRAREDAAFKLVDNHVNVLKDVINDDKSTNIDGRPLTQLDLERVAPEHWLYADECLREITRRLLGRRPGLDQMEEIIDPSNADQVEAWVGTCRYLRGRIQSEPGEKPGREPDMNRMAAAAMRAVLVEVGELALTKVVEASGPIWASFKHMLESGDGYATEADGAAAAHAHASREAAASALINNHENVLKDVTNPSRSDNIEGKPLTQRELVRIPLSHALYADQALREVTRRLLGRRPGLHQLEEHIDPYHVHQTEAWAQTATYLDCRIQSTDAEKPGRTPDLSPSAAAAMRAVLHEVAGMGITATLAASAPVWSKLHKRMQEHGCTRGNAAPFEAARKLIFNHELVLRDVCNPSTTRDATTKVSLTQTELVRVATHAAPYADQALRETARRLLAISQELIAENAIEFIPISAPGPKQAMQAQSFIMTAKYLDGRIQSTETEKPGRTPDMSPTAAAAMRAILKEIEAIGVAAQQTESPDTVSGESSSDEGSFTKHRVASPADIRASRPFSSMIMAAVSPRMKRRGTSTRMPREKQVA